jgi:hypothetical protein
MKKSVILAVCIGLLTASKAIADTQLAGWFSADNYDDCILDALKGTGNNTLAIRLAEKACRNKFPGSAPQAPSSTSETNKVTCGKAQFDPDETISSSVLFPNPTNNYVANVIKVGDDEFTRELAIYAQHNWPFSVWGLRVGARKEENDNGPAEWTYDCKGTAEKNVTVKFLCGKDQTPGYWLRIESIVSAPYLKRLEILCAFGDC